MEPNDRDFHRQFQDALKSGDMFALFERTREAIQTRPDDPEVRFLQALAMARLGDPHAALRLYQRNRVEELGTEDAIALRGRLLKDLAVRATGAERVDLFHQSSRAYRLAHDMSDGYYSGINAATTSLLAGDAREAAALAEVIGQRPDIADPQDYYAAASRAEAMLVRGQVEAATQAFAAARRRSDASPGMVASTARQVALIANQLSMSEERRSALLDSIRPTPVVHFCGHMFIAGWETEEEIAAAIRSILDEADVLIAYGPLACGADILIAEAVLERGGELHVVLPFAEEDFLTTSVRVGGDEWLQRYEKVRAAASEVIFATQMRCISDDQQFAYCSRLVMGLTQLRANVMQAETFQLAVWDGVTSGGTAGTAADVALWKEQGGVSKVIPIPRDRPPLRAASIAKVHSKANWALRSMLFADFAGFSRLDEDRLSQFLSFVMGRIAKVLDRHEAAVLSRNSWGDAVFAVITSPAQAAQIAMEIQSELTPQLLQSIGLPPEGGMRISLHHGPIFDHFDPVKGGQTFYGTEVTVAARISTRYPQRSSAARCSRAGKARSCAPRPAPCSTSRS